MSQQKIDGVIESVQYSPSGKLDQIRMYEKRGDTFSDLVLLSREKLLIKLKAGKKVFIGKRTRLMASTFEIGMPVLIFGQAGSEVIISGLKRSETDNILGAPQF